MSRVRIESVIRSDKIFFFLILIGNHAVENRMKFNLSADLILCDQAYSVAFILSVESRDIFLSKAEVACLEKKHENFMKFLMR